MTTLPTRHLRDLTVSALGLGCMGMSAFYGPLDQDESLRTLDRALELGVTFYDTADMYGPHTNEELLGGWLQGKRDRVVLATKFGIQVDPGSPGGRRINGTPAYVKRAIEGSLKRLNTDHVDLYYLHRVDASTPIEDTVGAMAELVQAGQVRAIGLSEVSPETLRRANAVHPITAVQSEYSLWTRDPEDGVLATCRELGVGFVPYSPLGRGFLTGQIRSPEDFAPDDFRRHNPRFQGDAFQKNLDLVEQVGAIAAEKGCTPGQLALAWVLAQGDDLVPIPGTKRVKYLEENLGALDVQLSPSDLARIEAAFPKDAASGTRYPEATMNSLNG
ncbi:aldo/keto reductase [Deinococcus sp. KSM4-11]|uniref:aldo/keto reductase n=1 Tax=Deinococcus sp. KSM4-11 TaxID=2568654 RepID=UPI0010A33F4B|nr:aldo/keto reductase [Deinococcus sp. KSM4-11]THF88506.1 aldo/keto reductase [Deinococcus sp. KSM4-11]